MSIEMHRSDDNLEVTQKFSEKRTTTKATVGAAKKKGKKSRSRSSKRAATPLNDRPTKLKVLPDANNNKSYDSIQYLTGEN